tara:strand:- start:441 stop:635 length:195 start_codon:yes stop_codon:yes gene_type:complete
MKAIIRIVITSPEEVTRDEFREWIENELGLKEDINTENPLISYQLDPADTDDPHINTTIKISGQ